MNLQTLAGLLNAEPLGPGDTPVEGVRDIERLAPEDALQDHCVYFIETPAVFKRHPKAVERGVILTTPALAPNFPRALLVPDAEIRVTFIKMLKHFDPAPTFVPGISPHAHIHPMAKVAADAVVLPGATVMENALIGAGCILYPGVVVEPGAVVGDGTVLHSCAVIGHRCVIGRNGIIHGGAVIGADGFGFFDQPGRRHKIPHIGNVAIGDDVEIGAGCTIDRATIETTAIGDHTKLDDQVHIGHNCRLGRYIYIAANSAVGGSTTIEDWVMISGSVLIKDHLRIARGSVMMGLSGVAQDTEPKTAYFGIPARPARQMHKMHAALERLPELLVKVRELEAKLAAAIPNFKK